MAVSAGSTRSSGSASIGDYIVNSKLGHGSFAVVYRGYHRRTKVPVAIKALSRSKLNAKLLANLECEIAIMRQINHPNIVKLYDLKKTEKHIYLVLEYCAGGDLQQYMRRQSSSDRAKASNATTRLAEPVARHFLHELAKGIQCLWQNNLIHRDLKPQNLLLSEDSPTATLKIADFGFARHLATASMAETLCGSPLYMAPEILKFQKYDAKADLWSVGTILYEMVVGTPPYNGNNHVQLLANIERQDLQFPATVEVSVECRDLLVGLLRRSPMMRIGFDEFFEHMYVGLEKTTRQSSIHDVQAAIVEEEGEGEEEDTRVLPPPPPTQDVKSSSVKSTSSKGTGQSVSDDPQLATPAFVKERSVSMSNADEIETNDASSYNSSDSGQGSTKPPPTGAIGLSGRARSGRNRRSTSSGAILIGQASNSPRLSPQMSPNIMPSPSPRINPFKTLSDSPPGAAALLNASSQMRHSIISSTPRSTVRSSTQLLKSSSHQHKRTKGSGHALDSSGEYVLVDSHDEKATPQESESEHQHPKRQVAYHGSPSESSTTSSTAGARSGSAMTRITPFAPESTQKLVDIIILRTQAIAPIADQLWEFGSLLSSRQDEQVASVNLASMFSLSSSTCSASEHMLVGISAASMEDSVNEDLAVEKKQYVCSAEALALYVKCLTMIQYGLLHFQGAQRATQAKPDVNRKMSMALLTELFNTYLERAEDCKKRMATCFSNADGVKELQNRSLSQDELLYNHALRLAKEAAVKEVLGQSSSAYSLYLQAMLMLECVVMDFPGWEATIPEGDRSMITDMIHSLEVRLRCVSAELERSQATIGPSEVLKHSRLPITI